ncbi:MAG TPA: PQQ-dependent dehydrogenase, methanol/ethanol family [Myxococcota bacterium]
MRAQFALLLLLSLPLGLGGCGDDEPIEPAAAPTRIAPPAMPGVEAIDDARLVAAASEPQSWLTYGGSYAEQRWSTLEKINAGNVAQLGLAFSYDTHTTRGLEATPIVVGGVLYTTGSWSIVYAVDAKTGKEIWRYDPKVPGETGPKACCDVVNRGVAAYKGKIIVGTLDGRVVALDAKTGIPIWEKVTVDQTKPYTITMAPRVIKGNVIIGNGGAELGVRGYVSAYDAETGELVWRFYTVPGDPAQPQENPALDKALPTWTGDTFYKIGGGGTVWDAIAFDPELDLMYVGTGNGSPWARKIRSPGGGDNLYLSSILALRPDTGELVWHYQTTPADNWDYTAVQHIMLADLTLDGQPRKVLMQAPKNGFFYVLDRATGELLSAKNYVEVTWATHVDMKTGRPVETPLANYDAATQTIKPSPLGGHNWQPMSFNPKLGLVYIPANDIAWAFGLEKNFVYRPGGWNNGNDPTTGDAIPRKDVSGRLIAWDPVKQEKRWEQPYPQPWNGGTLATAGGLVFQGTAHGTFAAYDAAGDGSGHGKVLWEVPAGTGVMAGPSTYEIDGEQYVAVMAGWGGAFGLVGGDASQAANEGAGSNKNDGRLLVFKLGGTAQIPALEKLNREVEAIAGELDPARVKAGNFAYHRWCAFCHGVGAQSGGVLPDLRTSQLFFSDALTPIVMQGQLLAKGMPNLSKWMTQQELDDVRVYITAKRNALAAEQAAAPASAAVAPSAPGGN